MSVWPSKDDLAAAGYMAGWRFVRMLPESVAYKLFEFGADIASKGGRGPEQLRKNLGRVVGAENVTRALVRDSMRSYMRYWCEAFRLPAIHRRPGFHEQLKAGIEGLENFEAAYARGKGVILALPHTGNWDMAGAFLVGHVGGFTTVAERLKPESLYQAFVDFRESLGFEVLPLTGGAQPFDTLKARLNEGKVIALLSERDLSRTGVSVEFFGEPANMAAGPALLAQQTGAALCAVHLWFEKAQDGTPRWGKSVSVPIEVTTVEETTQRLADRFEEAIARHPADWHMLQPQWNSDVEERRAERAARARGERRPNHPSAAGKED